MALPLSSLRGFFGKRISCISRVRFSPPDGSEDADDGALEIELDGEALLLDAAADGESIRLQAGPWEDPFSAPLSDENARYIKEYGRWRRVDCAEQEHFCDFVGRVLGDARPLMNEWGRLAGVRFSAEGSNFWFVVEGDECHLYWAHPIGFTEGRFSSG